MNADDRRRFGAVAALVLGVFAALSLIPGLPTGPAGEGLGAFLWQALGVGALGFPLLGLAVGLAGLARLPFLDMKRAAILVAGLCILVPYFIGVIGKVGPEAQLGAFSEWSPSGRLTGIAPAFLAQSVTGVVGTVGGVLLGFLVLSALTLATIAWHPLQRLERGGAAAARQPPVEGGGMGGEPRERR